MNEASPALQHLRGVFDTPTLAHLDAQCRPERMPLVPLRTALDDALAASGVTDAAAVKVRCAALWWHDHLEESHALSQELEGDDGSFLHGLMHRREPDYSNAKYWFHRVGTHPAYPEIARRAGPLLQASPALREALLDGTRWDPIAMIDAVAEAVAGPRTADAYRRLQQVQRVELDALLVRFCA